MEVHGIEEWEYSRLNRRRDSTSTYKPTLEPPCCSRLNASILHRPARRSTNLEAIFRQLTILSFINYRSFRNGTRQEGRQDLKEDKALQEASVRPVSRSVPVDHVKAAKLTILFTCSSADMPVSKRHGESQRVLITESGGWQFNTFSCDIDSLSLLSCTLTDDALRASFLCPQSVTEPTPSTVT
jgi:hypothetical protein